MPGKETDAMKEKEKFIDRIQPRTYPLPDVVTQLSIAKIILTYEIFGAIIYARW